MMEQIAKTAPIPQSVPPAPSHQTSQLPVAPLSWEGVPIDILRHFDINIGTISEKEVAKLQEIYAWGNDGSESMGDALLKISRLEAQLGAPQLSGHRWDKLWRWIRITKNIDNLDKQRESLRRRWML